MKLPIEYYQNEDVLFLAKDLVGKCLVTNFNGQKTSGIIMETEAYRGPEDKASHAYQNRKTNRTSVMFEKGGICYVYFCYGIHHLFNVITNDHGIPHAILIRAISPLEGIQIMLKRRNKTKVDTKFANGPATLTQALGITTAHNGISLTGNQIWIEDRHIKISHIEALPRVGIDYAGDHALLPWRFKGTL